MPGFVRSPYTDANFLKSLFNDATDEFLILKELIQNADDSGATTITLGFSAGLPDATHPLLRAPALFAVNDGPLREEDALALVSLGRSTKGGDASTVGKFGLGLKSVFFLAEALFFLDGRISPEVRWHYSHFDILSPWLSGDAPRRPEWKTFTQADRGRVVAYLETLGIPKSFVVWIPLRRELDCLHPKDQRLEAVIQNFAGDKPFALSTDLLERVGALLPLLGHLKEVVAYPGEPVTKMSFRQIGESRTPNLDDMFLGERRFRGEIVQSQHGLRSSYGGTESLIDHEGLNELRRSTSWPKTEVITASGKEGLEDDPSTAHGAALWTKTHGTNQGRLAIQFSVFLPVGEPEVLRLEGSCSYTLTLHGYFFLRPDRKSIFDWTGESLEGPVDSEGKLRQRWNGLLAREAVLPQVVPELANMAQGMSQEDITVLVSALKRSDFFNRHRDALFTRLEWVRAWEPGGFRWAGVASSARLLPVPDAPGIGRLIEKLYRQNKAYVLVDARASNLTALNRLPSPWPHETARDFLSGIDFMQVFGDPQQLAALTELVHRLGVRRFRDKLLPNLRIAVVCADENEMSQNKKGIAALLVALLPLQILRLPRALSPSTVERWMDADTSLLLLPSDFPPVASSEKLNADDIRKLATLAEPDDLLPALKFLSSNAPTEETLREMTDDLPLIPTLFDDGQPRRRFTPREVRTQADLAHLFGFRDSDSGILELLRDVITEVPIYVVTRDILSLYRIDARSLDLRGILSSLHQTKQLGPAPARLALLRALLNRYVKDGIIKPDDRSGFRLLIHGSQKHSASLESPLLTVGREANMWWDLATLAADASPLGWTVVRESIDFLTERQMADLNVTACRAADLEALIAASPTAFPAHKLTRDQADALILSIKRPELLAALPIFESVTGERVALGPGLHLEGGFALNHEGRVILLKDPKGNEQLRDRLKTLAPPLTAADVWQLFRDEPEPWTHWQTLLSALERSTPVLAYEIPWWPLKLGGGCAPRDVVAFADRHASTQLRKLRDASERSATVEADLLGAFWSSHRIQLSKLLNPDEVQAEAVQQLVRAAPSYQIGNLQVGADDWVQALNQASPDDVPLLSLMAAVPKSARERVFSGALGPVGEERLYHMLDLLFQQATTSENRKSQEAALHLYPQLLTNLQEQGAVPRLSVALNLRNRAGEWRKPYSLTSYGPDLADSHVLAEDHARALYGTALYAAPKALDMLDDAPEGSLDEQLTSSVNTLRAYIREWEHSSVPREQLGAFLGLLDGNDELHKTALGYLGTYDLGVLRERALRDVPPANLPRGFRSFKDMLDKIRLVVNLEQSNTQTVENLLGEPMVAHFRDDAELSSVFTEAYGTRAFSHDGLYYYPLTLKTVALHRADLDLPTLLIDSIRWLLQRGYGLGTVPPFLSEEFGQVVKSGQTALAATQRRLLKAASQTWGRQLGVTRESDVRKLLDRIDQTDRAAEQAREEGAAESEREAENQIRKLQAELKNLVEHDTNAQQALLSGMRRKISEQQYVPESVPFELFQNADDALREWQEMTGAQDDARAGFSLELSEATLRVVYHGRPVNFYAYEEFDGRPRGFNADLEKMLMLMSSDKADNVTGHFGLGFKSVYLLSDRPTVLSGRLSFSVRGGVYPVMPDQDQVQTLQAHLQERSPAGVRDGTLIELPLRDPDAGRLALERFARLAPITLSLAHALKRFRLTSGHRTDMYVRHETHVTQGVSVVACQGNTTSWRALKVSSMGVSVVIPLGDSGPSGMDPGDPNIWVTAPTNEVLGLPFLIDAPFPLDPGRAQLAHNHEILVALTTQWAPGLMQAFQAFAAWTQNWAVASTDLGLDQAVSRETFFNSFWQTFAKPLTQGGDTLARATLRRLLWGSDGALSGLALDQNVTPTGLPGAHEMLVKVGDSALHALDFPAKLVSHLSVHPRFDSKFKPGRLIARDIASTLRDLGLPTPTQNLTLLVALEAVLDDQRVTPTDAPWLSTLLGDVDMASWREDQKVGAWLSGLRFLAQDGQYRSSGELLTEATEPDSDEKQRVAFAPLGARLSNAYPVDTLTLFRQLRRQAPTSATSAWLLSAPPESRVAALYYLSKSSPYAELAEEVRRESKGTWLNHENLLSSAAYKALDTQTKGDVLHVLRQIQPVLSNTPSFQLPTAFVWEPDEEEEDEDLDELELIPTAPPEMPAASHVLERLYRWWQVEGRAFTKDYENRTYPDEQHFDIKADFDVSTLEARVNWVSLLILGSLQSIGRAKPGQHSGFLRLCKQKGWLKTFSSEASDTQWLGVVREYLADDPEMLEYYHWMQRFVGFYQLGHWLGAYVDMFDQAERHGVHSLQSLFKPAADPRQQGGGVDAPPLTRTLGIGGPFVVRELLRTQVLTNSTLHPSAYMPTRRVRYLIGLLSGASFLQKESAEAWSNTIHDFLVEHLGADRAKFGNDFDLPLQALAGYSRRDEKAKALQRDILGFEMTEGDQGSYL